MKTLVLHLTAIVTLVGVSALPSAAQAPIPHSCQSLTITTNGAAQLRLTGQAALLFRNYYDLYPVETSENLMHWELLTTLVRTNNSTNVVEYLDLQSTHPPSRYYRTPTNQFPTPFPKPTGPYPVGTFTRYFSDPTRTNRHHIRGNSSFPVTFWYPAGGTAQRWPEPLMETKVAELLYGQGSDNARRFAQLVDHALPGAPAATNGAPFPVLLYSHGAYGWRTENAHDFNELASHGFIVASADHLDCGASLTEKGVLVRSDELSSNRKQLFDNKVADLRLLAESLPRLNLEDPILQGRLDLMHKGAFGWSLGAGATLQLCLDDPSFLAYASLDGSLGDVSLLRTNSLQRPLLILGASSPLFDYSTNRAYAMQFRNSEHRTYADPLPLVEAPGPVLRRVEQSIAGCVVSFFRRHLKNDDDSVLDDPNKVYPDVYGFKKK